MIGRIRGEVIERAVGRLVVDVNGVGYLVVVSALVNFPVGERVDLHIHTAVRDDAITLFGFSTREEKELFDLLIGVPSVGPTKAMGILQTPVANFVDMVARREPARLAKLPGVGKKTAERILVDLADKVAAIGGGGGAPTLPAKAPKTPPAGPPVLGDLVSALVNMGFKEATAIEVGEASVEQLGAEAGLDNLLRDALSRARPKL